MSFLGQMLCPQVDVPCRILLSGFQVAKIIGKGGILIKELRDESGAVVNILDKQLPAAFANRDERVALIRGSADAVKSAVAGIIRLAFGAPVTPGNNEEEHQRAVEVMIPEMSCSHLIGEKGTRISGIMSETGCDLHIVRELVSGLAEQKRVRITGSTFAAVISAACYVQELLVDLVKFGTLSERHFDIKEGPTAQADMVPRDRTSKGTGLAVCVLLAKEDTAWVIGKRGSKIGKLRELAKVNVNDAPCPPFQPTDAILEITGAPLREQIHVLEMVIDDLMVRQDATDTTRFLVPTEHFGAVIGVGGVVITRIAEQTGATLSQQPAERSGTDNLRSVHPMRVIEISGSERQRTAAATAVYEAVEQARTGAGDASLAQPVQAAMTMSAPTQTRTQTLVQTSPLVTRSMALDVEVGRRQFEALPSTASSSSRAVPSSDRCLVETQRPESHVAATLPRPLDMHDSAEKVLPPHSNAVSSSAEASEGSGRKAAREAEALPAVRTKTDASLASIGYNICADFGVPDVVSSVSPSGLALFVVLPTKEAAQHLACGDLGASIARRTGSQLTAGIGSDNEPLLRLSGTPAANAAACFFVQEALWLAGFYTVPPASCGRMF